MCVRHLFWSKNPKPGLSETWKGIQLNCCSVQKHLGITRLRWLMSWRIKTLGQVAEGGTKFPLLLLGEKIRQEAKGTWSNQQSGICGFLLLDQIIMTVLFYRFDCLLLRLAWLVFDTHRQIRRGLNCGYRSVLLESEHCNQTSWCISIAVHERDVVRISSSYFQSCSDLWSHHCTGLPLNHSVNTDNNYRVFGVKSLWQYNKHDL